MGPRYRTRRITPRRSAGGRVKSQRGRETSPWEEKPIACIAFQSAAVCDWQQIFIDFPGVGIASDER
jgi:hypothetical protein